MSLIKLLAEFPNFSARKVRRLAKQISFLEKLELPVGEGSGTAKGIADDLMDYNLMQAKSEEVLNDDVKKDLPGPPPGFVPPVQDNQAGSGVIREPIDLKRVVPIDVAVRAVNTASAVGANVNEFNHVSSRDKAVDMLRGSSFKTDRKVVE